MTNKPPLGTPRIFILAVSVLVSSPGGAMGKPSRTTAPDAGTVPSGNEAAVFSRPGDAKPQTHFDDIPEVTDKTFDNEVLRAETPTMVIFCARWLKMCHAFLSEIRRLDEEQQGRFRARVYDIDLTHEWAERLEIRSIPIVVLFKNGKRVDQTIGLAPSHKLLKMLDGKGSNRATDQESR